MKKWNVYAAAVLAAVGILGGCGAKNAESQAPAETQAAEQSAQESSVEESRETSAEESKTETEKNGTLSVTYVKSPLNVPSIVEQDQEIFASVFGPMGYDVQYSDLTTGPEQTQALASGDIQFLNAVGATSVILSASNDADIKIMSIYSRSPKAFKLFAKDDSIKTAEDLKGKKVAGPKGTILHELLVSYLNNAGMTEDDIEFMAMGIQDAQAALAGGSVDAALLAGPTAYNMEKDGFYIVTDGEGLTEATIVTATSEKFYEEHPELVKEFFNFVTTTESLQEILDNSPVFTNLDVLDENLEQHWLPEEEEFMASLTEEQMKTPVLQTGTKYTNDFWNQFGQDLVAYCQGTIKDADEILKNMDKNRAEAAKTAKDPNWQ